MQIVALQGALLEVTSYAMAAWMWQQPNTCKGHHVASGYATVCWEGLARKKKKQPKAPMRLNPSKRITSASYFSPFFINRMDILFLLSQVRFHFWVFEIRVSIIKDRPD